MHRSVLVMCDSFTSKLAVALFEAVQDNRAMSQQISRCVLYLMAQCDDNTKLSCAIIGAIVLLDRSRVSSRICQA